MCVSAERPCVGEDARSAQLLITRAQLHQLHSHDLASLGERRRACTYLVYSAGRSTCRKNGKSTRDLDQGCNDRSECRRYGRWSSKYEPLAEKRHIE